jgi:hypothetical protein
VCVGTHIYYEDIDKLPIIFILLFLQFYFIIIK